VNGSVFEPVELAAVVALVVEAEVVEAVGVELDVVAAGAGVVLGAVVVVVEPWCEPPSGSTYCWSPADGPVARAAAGARMTSAPNRQRAVIRFFILSTLRVLQDMRLLAFSDLHRDRSAARRLVELAGSADIIVGAGDFASFRLGLASTIDSLRGISGPTILVPGNHESDSSLKRACSGWDAASVLHGQGTSVGGVEFFGLGGACPPTPFPWSFDLSEEEAESRLEKCPEGAVLISHSPPRGHLDEAFGRNLGSESVLQAIEARRPALVLCGHIHEAWGRESRIGETRIVNLGPEGRWFEL
jgi:uncharacterized protein